MNGAPVSLRTVPGPASPAKGAAADAPLPARVRLLSWGRSESVLGPVTLDEASAAAFAENQRRIGRERIALDFEHNTVEGTPEYARTQEPRRIAAMGRPVIVPGDGLWLEDVTWTETGAGHARDFEDLSPAAFLDGAGRVIGLHSAALTRTGAVHGLTFLSAPGELGAMLLTLSSAAALGGAGPSQTQAKLPTMPDTHPGAAPELTALATRLEALEAALARLTAPDLTAALQPFSARLDAVEQNLKTRDTAAEEAERARLLADAARDGKVVPLSADSLKLTPLAVLRELVAGLPKNVVPLSASAKPGADAPAGAELKGLARVAAAINAQLGGK